jgi:peptidylprolyl isomerase
MEAPVGRGRGRTGTHSEASKDFLISLLKSSFVLLPFPESLCRPLNLKDSREGLNVPPQNSMKKILLSLTIAGIAALCPGRMSSAAGDASGTVDFNNVTVSDATNMSSKPKVTAQASLPSAALKVKDLVVGKGEAATPDSTVSVQYVGVRYADGKQFDSSWERGGATSFSLKKVVKGFTQGIGGKGEISPMKVGGRRIIIVPSEMGYGEAGTPDGSIPPNASLVFVVDLIALK